MANLRSEGGRSRLRHRQSQNDRTSLHGRTSRISARRFVPAADPLARTLRGRNEDLLGSRRGADAARAAELIGGSKLTDAAYRVQLFKGGAEAINNSRDPTLELVRSIEPEARAARKRYEDEVLGVERDAYAKIAHALFEIEGTNHYPDATFTLRLSYGAVKGYR